MIPYMDLNEQVDSDFTHARRRALLRRVLARLRKKSAYNQLLCFDDQRRVLRAKNRRYLARRVVEVEKIVGSVGRCAEFDRSFLPLRASVAQRWKRIDRAFHRSEDLLKPREPRRKRPHKSLRSEKGHASRRICGIGATAWGHGIVEPARASVLHIGDVVSIGGSVKRAHLASRTSENLPSTSFGE